MPGSRGLTGGGNVDREVGADADLSMYLIFYRGELTIPSADRGAADARARQAAAALAPSLRPLGPDGVCGQRTLQLRVTGAMLDLHDRWSRSHGTQGQRADFSCANLGPLDFSATSVNLSAADLVGVDLRGANLSTAVLDHAEMKYADLTGAQLVRTSLRSANLIDANLSQARLAGADPSDAILSGTALRDADFTPPELPRPIFAPS